MKFLKWFGIVILSLVVLFLIIPLFLPSNFHIERSINIEKPVDIVFQSALDMNKRKQWDPWIEMDPKAEIKINVNPEIIGSGYTWNGEVIGKGKITIKEFVPDKKIKSKIEFISPQSMESDVIWTFDAFEKGTKTTWAFEGSLSYPIEKWFGLFMDKSLGLQFEKGLSNFKELVESLPGLSGKTGVISEAHFDGLSAITIKAECDSAKITSNMISMYSKLMSYLKVNNREISGFPFAIYHKNEDEGQVLLECGLPVSEKIPAEGDINFISLPPAKTIMASHFGHYNTIGKTRKAIRKYISEHNLEINGSPWEEYVTDPIKEPDQDKWETKVYFPIK